MPENKRTVWRDGMILLCVFLAATALHGLVGGFAKQLTIYRDEWLYASMADSLQAGRGITVQGASIAFQKVGYSLFLVPFFGIRDPELRLRLISWLNSALVMSAIFPVWLIGKELGLRKSWRWVITAAACFLPETLITATFMAENLYWPLVFWCVWLWLLNERKSRWQLAILGGTLGCFTYLVKEAFLAVAAAFIILQVVRILRDRKANRRFDRKQLLCLLLYIVTLFGLIAVLRWIVFSSADYSYGDQIAASAVSDWGRAGYLATTIFYYMAATLCTVLVLPFTLTLTLRREMDANARRFTDLVWLYLGITIVFIAYAVCLPYDYGDEIPRFHLRYYAPGLILLQMAMALGIQQAPAKALSGRNLLTCSLLSLGAVAVIILCFRGNRYGSAVDQFSLAWYDEIYWGLDRVEKRDLGTPLFIGIIAALVLLSVLLLWRKKPRIAFTAYAFVFLAIITWDWFILVPRLQGDYKVDAALRGEVYAVNEALADVPADATLLVLADHEADPAVRHCIDTFLEVSCKVEAPLYVEQARTWAEDGVAIEAGQAEYLLVGGQSLTERYTFPDCDLIEIGTDQLHLYRCQTPGVITLALNRESILTDAADWEDPLDIWFYGENENAGLFVTGGLYDPEDGFTWTQGHEVTFEIQADRVYDTVTVELEVGDPFNGIQPFEVWCDAQLVYESEVVEPDTFLFDLHPDSTAISFTIRLPEAIEVNRVIETSDDGRCVAIQMRRMSLWVEEDE